LIPMILDAFKLDGKTALVTGCSRGIGATMAIALAEAGADIIGVSSGLTKDGGEVGGKVRALGRRFSGYACDLSKRESVYQLLDQLGDAVCVDILVNNAGIIHRAPVEKHEDADWDRVLSVNLDAPFILSREIGKTMLVRQHGKILFTASLLSFQGGITVASYAASKGAVAQLVMALSNEWAGSGICVNGIAPGYISTDATAALQNDSVRSPAILSRIPCGRWGVPADLAGATVFLCSPAANYITGIILPVDGGWLGR